MNSVVFRNIRVGMATSALCLMSAGTASLAQDTSPKYKADVPESVMTPDTVTTDRLGQLNFFDGLPDAATVETVYDNLDFARGVDAFLNGMPAASVYAILEGFKQVGVNPGDVAIAEDLIDARSLYLTPNTTTVYCMMELNLRNGPMVMEVPPGVLGPIGDAFFRWVTDVGLTGPDQGEGGKYLFLPPGYEGEVPEGYFVVNVPTYRNPAFFRILTQNGDVAGSVKAVKDNFRLYPLSEVDNPPEQKFVNVSGAKYNTVHANDFSFFEEINAVIQEEPADAFNSEIVGNFAAIGIKKGQPFAPDERMKKILTDAVAVGNATARAIAFAPRDKSVYYYPDRQWYSSFAGAYTFIDNGAMVQDNRAMWHYIATGVTPAMATPKVGTGSVYPTAVRDVNGDYLDGSKHYTVTLPGPVPAANFWAFTAYDSQTRSLLETDQQKAGLDSLSSDVKANDDGSYTVWFGPEAPTGHESNWVQTMPNKSYFVFMRLYGPLEPWFDKTWKPGDFEPLK